MEHIVLISVFDPPLRWELDAVSTAFASSSSRKLTLLPVQHDATDARGILPQYRSLLAQLVCRGEAVFSSGSTHADTADIVRSFFDEISGAFSGCRVFVSSELRNFYNRSEMSLFEHVVAEISQRRTDVALEITEVCPPGAGKSAAFEAVTIPSRLALVSSSPPLFERIDRPDSLITRARAALSAGDFVACSQLLSPRIISVCRRYGLYGCPVALAPGKSPAAWRFASLCGWHADRTPPPGAFDLPRREAAAAAAGSASVAGHAIAAAGIASREQSAPDSSFACEAAVAGATSHIAILGGSFSPITSGHAAVACMVAEAAGYAPTSLAPASASPRVAFSSGASAAPSSLSRSASGLPRPPPVDEVWVVPCGARPDKPSLNVSAWHRYAMAVLAIEDAMPLPLPALPTLGAGPGEPELARGDSGSGSGSRFVQLRRHISGESLLTGDEHSPLGGASAAPADRWSVGEAPRVDADCVAGPAGTCTLPVASNLVPVRVMPLELLQPAAVPSYVLLGSLTRMFNSGGGAGGSVAPEPHPAGGAVEAARVPVAATAEAAGRTLFSLIIGADLLPTLPAWAHAQLLLRESSFLVVPRPGYPLRLRVPLRSESGASSHERIAAGFGSTLVNLPPGDPATEPHCAWLVRHPDGSALETPEVSSTAVRLAVAQASAAGPDGRAPCSSAASAAASAAGAGAAVEECGADGGAGSAPSAETASFPWSAAARMLTPSVLHYMRDNRLYV